MSTLACSYVGAAQGAGARRGRAGGEPLGVSHFAGNHRSAHGRHGGICASSPSFHSSSKCSKYPPPTGSSLTAYHSCVNSSASKRSAFFFLLIVHGYYLAYSPCELFSFFCRWFGIVLLPMVSFSADAIITITFFVRQSPKAFFRTAPPPESLAKARMIDMSIQFLLFWMPVVTLLGWWTNRTMSMLFDLFEVVLLVGACFLVNYVTADAKTNWAEGIILIAFYAGGLDYQRSQSLLAQTTMIP
ncbi:hypothetical protein BJY52DRAFT_1259862, partial [Lactarius psammicola]